MSKLQVFIAVVVMSLFMGVGLSFTAFFVASGNKDLTQVQAANASTGQGVNIQSVADDVYVKKSTAETLDKPAITIFNNTLSDKSTEEIAKLKSNIVLVSCGSSFGSGVIFNTDGYILTNYHVIKSKSPCFVAFEDPGKGISVGEKIPASIVKYNEKNDLALLKINKKLNTYIPIGDSEKLQIGEKIVTIGNPELLVNTVADGIVSSVRKFPEVTLIQITSPITHGSSGGALLNMRGELVGITSSGFSGNGNLNFAVSSSDFKSVLDSNLITSTPQAVNVLPDTVKPDTKDSVDNSKNLIIGKWIPSYAKAEKTPNELIEFLKDGTYRISGKDDFMVYSGTYSFSSPNKLDFKQETVTIKYQSTGSKDIFKRPEAFSVDIKFANDTGFTISATTHFASLDYIKIK